MAWVLVGSAFLCGAILGASVFSTVWRHEAQRGSDAKTALVAATARNGDLGDALAAARARAGRATAAAGQAREAQAAAQAASRALRRRAAALAHTVGPVGRAAGSVSRGAASVGTSVDRLSNELKALAGYLASTPASQIDPGYVATQTDYLRKQLDALAAARSDLDGAVAGFGRSARTLSDRAGALSGHG